MPAPGVNYAQGGLFSSETLIPEKELLGKITSSSGGWA